MPAKTDLREFLNGFGKETEVSEPSVSEQAAVPAFQRKPKSEVPVSRRDKRHISGYFDAAVYRQVKIICAEDEKTLQDVLGDALNALFVNRGKPPIA